MITKVTTYIAIAGLIIAVCGLLRGSHGREQTRFFDAHGRSTGTAVPLGQGSTRYFDAQGRSLGTSTTRNGTTQFFDARGNRIGEARR